MTLEKYDMLSNESRLSYEFFSEGPKGPIKKVIMFQEVSVVMKKNKTSNITVIKKMKDYSQDAVFKKKAEEASAFLIKNVIPKNFARKNK